MSTIELGLFRGGEVRGRRLKAIRERWPVSTDEDIEK